MCLRAYGLTTVNVNASLEFKLLEWIGNKGAHLILQRGKMGVHTWRHSFSWNSSDIPVCTLILTDYSCGWILNQKVKHNLTTPQLFDLLWQEYVIKQKRLGTIHWCKQLWLDIWILCLSSLCSCIDCKINEIIQHHRKVPLQLSTTGFLNNLLEHKEWTKA